MRPATAAVTNLLNGWNPESQITVADLYTFTLITGEVLRYTAWQQQIGAPLPNTSSPNFTFAVGPRFDRKKTKIQIGTQVSELEIDIDAGGNDLIGTLTWQEVAHLGLFDGAYCELDRCFMSGTPAGTTAVVGTICWFYGRVADIDIGRTRLVMKVKSLLDLLTNQMPRRLYQASCTFIFGDAMCGYDRVAGKNAIGTPTGIGQQTITAQAGSTQNAIFTTFTPSPTTAYDQGTIISTSGNNNGYSRTIGVLNGGVIYFLKPWIYPVTAGVDTFNLLPGCDHTRSTCTGTFQNNSQAHGRFGGFPDIPPPETAV